MDRKSWLLVALAVVLGVVYAVFFTNWLRSPPIEILPQVRDTLGRGGRRAGGGALPVTFALDDSYRLSSVKVIELATNGTKVPTVMWHLLSNTNSSPTKAILYGRAIDGMKPAPDNSAARPLVAGAHYQILVESGRRHGDAVFHTKEAASGE